jgi:hypothetical protein
MIVPISPRARKYGYVIWPSRLDQDMRSLLGEAQTAQLIFEGHERGTKKVDWSRRRISVGSSQTRKLTETAKEFVLVSNNGKLFVSCR